MTRFEKLHDDKSGAAKDDSPTMALHHARLNAQLLLCVAIVVGYNKID